MIKGFVLDDERLKQGETAFGKDYFKDLLERVRSIRASERRYGNKSPIYMLNAALIMIESPQPLVTSTQWFKINFIML